LTEQQRRSFGDELWFDSAYQQVMDVADGALDLLEELIGCSLEDAKSLLAGGSRRAHPGTIPERTLQPDETPVPPVNRGFAPFPNRRPGLGIGTLHSEFSEPIPSVDLHGHVRL